MKRRNCHTLPSALSVDAKRTSGGRCATSAVARLASRSVKPTSDAAQPITSVAVRPLALRSPTLVSPSALLSFCVGDFITSEW